MDEPKTHNQQSAMGQLDGLLEEAKQVRAEIDATSATSKKDLEQVATEVKESTDSLNTIFGQLDQADNEAGDELDTIILQEAAASGDEE